MALSMRWAKRQGERRLAVGSGGTARRGLISAVMDPEGGFGAESLFNRAIFASRRGVPLKKLNFVWILLSFAPQGAARKGQRSDVGPEGGPPGHSAPSPILPVGKNFKMQNFGGVLRSFAPSPFPGRIRPTGRPYPPANFYTTRTVLSSVKKLKASRFVPFCPVLRRFISRRDPLWTGLTDRGVSKRPQQAVIASPAASPVGLRPEGCRKWRSHFAFFILHFAFFIFQWSSDRFEGRGGLRRYVIRDADYARHL